ncbi:YdbL family protein [Pleionea litopenaei]|uniref:YdbL family protein n=1 Tax=Pleionea litopenaei TaxID=3070815 RepID=A0AA51RQY4_9GAMM|nr:YdbL family protein [Pleionea sp. HL-JVS1]WMS85834.1 YdbL family protein [Pleionea sp. HL-JVS1]
MITRSFKSLFTVLVLCLTFGLSTAMAADLDSAKASGLIGEKPDGYLGLVVSDAPADVKALVEEVNTKRKQKYLEIANKRNATLADVERIAGEAALKKTLPGHYIFKNGEWVKK